MDFELLDCAEAAFESYEELEERKEDDEATTRVEDDHEFSTVLHMKTTFGEVYRKFSLICTELKLLYVAITRPRKLLLIYDDDAKLRAPLQKHWTKIGVVETIT